MRLLISGLIAVTMLALAACSSMKTSTVTGTIPSDGGYSSYSHSYESAGQRIAPCQKLRMQQANYK